MSLLDRYVSAVSKHLPREKRDDISSELREILRSQVEDEEALRQRPLTAAELGGILKKYGHPRDVAAGYGARQYLIGPEVFPWYVLSVKIVAGIMAAITAFMVLLTIILARESVLASVAQTLWTMASIGLVNLALVTISFAWLGRVGTVGATDDWNIDDLPEPDSLQQVTRSEVIGSLIGMVLLLCWWLGLNGLIARWFGWGPLPFKWTEVWTDVSAVAVAAIAASIARELMGLFRPNWARLYVATGTVLDLIAISVLSRLLSSEALVVTSGVKAPQTLVFIFDKFMFVALLVLTIGTLVSLVSGMVRLFRISRLGSEQHNQSAL